MYRIISCTDQKRMVRQEKIYDYEEGCQMVFEYIEGFYNTVRILSRCDYQSPNNYEKNYHSNKLN